ncbi:MAG TPA: hypothetical protein VFP59_00005 [Candidatus Angelobacter sp.]|nr:hypothetical protein [Candidatus Angelobacter sp.]
MAIQRLKVDRNGVLAGIRRAAKALGRPPKRYELKRFGDVSLTAVLRHFQSLTNAIVAAGLEPRTRGRKVSDEELLADWNRVRQQLGRLPRYHEYACHGRHAANTLCTRFGNYRKAVARAEEWARSREQPQSPATRPEGDKAIAMRWAGAMTAIPAELAGKRRVTDAFCAMIVNTLMGEEIGRKCWPIIMGQTVIGDTATSIQPVRHAPEQHGLTHPDELNLNEHQRNEHGLAPVNGRLTSGGILDDARTIMGPPFDSSALTNAPMNELGVVFLFGMLAAELGFQVESLRSQYPDCEARRQIQPGKWQRVRIEFEFESRNFLAHGHDPTQCDIIVCWKHNWAHCPPHIEVIELSKIVAHTA